MSTGIITTLKVDKSEKYERLHKRGVYREEALALFDFMDERDLLLGILHRAFLDAKSLVNRQKLYRSYYLETWERTLQDWFFDESEDYFSFTHCCNALGLSPNWARTKIIERLAT